MRFNRRTILRLSLLLGTLLNVTVLEGKVDETMLTQKQADEVIASGKLKRLKSKSDFPKIWYREMGLDDMSDVDGSFSVGCTGNEPHTRMIAGAVSEQYGLLIYEQGGIAYFRNLKLYRRENNKVECVHSESVDEARIKSIEGKLRKE
jgi:hypothetical protein